MSGTFDEWMSTQRHPEDYTKEEASLLNTQLNNCIFSTYTHYIEFLK